MIEQQKIMYFLTFCGKTAFFKLQDIFPECFLYRKDNQVEPMFCMEGDCPSNKNCMETLSKRIFVLFQEVIVGADLLILYYKKRNKQNSIGGTLFWKDMREPRNITINPYGWNTIKSRGNAYQFQPTSSFYLTGKSPNPTKDSSDKLALE